MCEVREERARTTRYRKHTRAFSCPSDCLLVLLTLLLLSTCCVYIFSSSPSVSARHARSRSLYSLAIFLAPYLVERSYFLHARIRLEVLKFEFTYNESRALLSLFAHLSLPAFTSLLLLLLLLLLRFACVRWFSQRSSRLFVVLDSKPKEAHCSVFQLLLDFVLEEEASNVESDALCARWSDAALDDDDDDDDDDGISCQRCLSVSDAERGAYRRSGCTRWSAE